MQFFCDKIKNKGKREYEKVEITGKEKENPRTINTL